MQHQLNLLFRTTDILQCGHVESRLNKYAIFFRVFTVFTKSDCTLLFINNYCCLMVYITLVAVFQTKC